MQLLVDGKPVDYSSEGEGPVLLFVHGWRDQKSTWQPLIKHLKSHFRCIAVDLPNFGASADNESVIDLAGFADTLAKFLEKLGITHYSYIGHSMGGQIGIYAVGHELLQPDRLILIASAGVRDDKAVQRKTLKLGAKVFRGLVPNGLKKKLYHAIGSDYDPSLKATHKAIIDAVLSTDVQQEASRIAVPTLLIYGSNDESTPPKYGALLHRLIRHSTYTELSGYDHFVHQQAAHEVAKLVESHMQGVKR